VLGGTKVVLDAITFTPDGRGIAAAGPSTLRYWPSLGEPFISPHLPAPQLISPYGLRFTPDGRRLFGSSSYQPNWLWYLDERPPYTPWPEASATRYGSNITPDGRFVVIGTTNTLRDSPGQLACRSFDTPGARVWVLDSPRRIESPPLFLPDSGQFLVMEFQYDRHGLDNCRYLFVFRHTGSGTELRTVPASCGELLGLVLSADGRYLAGIRTNSLFVLSTSALDHEPVRFPAAGRKHFTGLAFHPSGRFLAATSNDATVKLYDTSNWSLATTYTWDVGRMRSVAFSPDGMLAAAGSDTGKVVVWDVDV
jgi:WD40 repeat protein